MKLEPQSSCQNAVRLVEQETVICPMPSGLTILVAGGIRIVERFRIIGSGVGEGLLEGGLEGVDGFKPA